ncbi:MAG TPA: hypothetical protein DCG66_11630 [Brevundimonas sp.]|nr:hypothetical protein [Brevundimonas sp.]MBB1179144.1 hypothetical protein [Pseudomonas sp. FW305-3-2-15-E-TSA4]QFU30058.1 hypothetical protein BSP_00135 [Brevundimonas sp. Bb-A]HAF81649.1 hypothetical protein [Brevundimonas sp.]
MHDSIMKRLALIAAASASLAACAGGLDGPTVSTVGMPGALEPIHAAAFTKDQAVFWVSSNGCTRKEDLIPIVSIKGGDAIITLRRIDEDTCDKPSIRGVELKWSFEELGLAPGSPVSVNNPYQLPQT